MSVDGAGRHPAAWRLADGADLFSASYAVGLARQAERGRLDFVVFEDGFDRPAMGAGQRGGRLDALLLAARVAPATTSIGLLPVVTTTHTEPFHVSKNVATLDFVSGGRAGWKIVLSTTAEDADRFGRKPAAPLPELYAEASEAADVVARLWDSWEDDALIRDIATGRYVDRTKLHYVDFDGRFFRVRGPSITPRSPQAQPPIAVDVTTPGALGVAAERADLAFIHEADVAAATARQGEIRGATQAAGRDPDAVAVLATIDVLLAPTTSEAREDRLRLDSLAGSDAASSSAAVDFTGTPADLAALMADWFDAGAVDGFVIRPAVLPRDLTRLVVDVVPRLQQAGVFRREYSSSTLRGHFGWARPQNRYETADAP